VGEGQELLKGWLKIIPTADGDIITLALQRHEIETALACHGSDAEADIGLSILDRQRDLVSLRAGGMVKCRSAASIPCACSRW
jgi:hypothetical protein